MGAVISGWRLLYTVGYGAYGHVYQVRKGKASGAMKLFKSTDITMKNEVSMLRSLRGVEGVTKMYEYGNAKWLKQDWSIIVFELNDYTLQEYLDEDHDHNELIDIVKQVILILQRIHQREIIHGDLKSSNIMLNERFSTQNELAYKVQLIDFGLARKLSTTKISLSIFGGDSIPCLRLLHEINASINTTK